jgi:hypothetical protein
MRYVPDRTGRFAERPHYEPLEIDTMFERVVVEFLRGRHGKVTFPISTDDLTVLIENDAHDLDSSADLSSYGTGVEGVTEFTRGRKPQVRIAEHLSANRLENRYRTTLTHEYGHVRLHGYLFQMAATGNLFGAAPGTAEVIACKRETMITAARSDWMEWQAGYACGALLVPASFARACVADYRTRAGLFGPVAAASEHGQALIDAVVGGFQVSRDAARVRLSVLGILGTAAADNSLFV